MITKAAQLSKVLSSTLVLLVLLAGCGEQKSNGGMSSKTGVADVGNGSDGAGTGGGTGTGADPGSMPGQGTEPASSSDPNCQDGLGSTDPQISVYRTEVCVLVNKARAEAGLAPLVLDALLSKVAQDHAADMVQYNYFSHTNLSGQTPFDRMRAAGVKFGYAAENIATGAATPTSVMNMWMNSAGHRANILDSHYRKLGVGDLKKFWVQTFTD